MLIDENGELLQVDIDKSIISYFEELNRGGLIYHFSTVLHSFQAAHAAFHKTMRKLFKNTISENLCNNQKNSEVLMPRNY